MRKRDRLEAWRSRVERRGPTECWPWTGHFVKGYGAFKAGGRSHVAHRVAFEVHHGRPPVGVVRHTCDTTWCQNGAHTLDGTQLDNVADRVARGRSATGVRNGSAKLTPDLVQLCRLAHAEGVSMRELARRHGVHNTTMREAIKGTTWKL